MFGEKKTRIEHLVTTGSPIIAVIIGNGILLLRYLNSTIGTEFLIISALSIVGLILIILSKIPNFKKGIYFGFGTKQMDSRHKAMYFFGYLLIVSALFCSIFMSAP